MELHLIREKVNKIKKKLFKQSAGQWDGLYKSKTRGTGLQFKEHRVYSYGDEIRFIDWKLYAKTNNPYIKTFEEERNVDIEYIIDLNNNLFVGFENVFKIDALLEIYSLMSLVAKKFNDNINLTVIYDKVYRFESSSGEKSIIRFINFLEKIKLIASNGRWNTDYLIEHDFNQSEINNIITKAINKRKPIFFFLSDLEDYNLVNKYFKLENFHPFMLLSPVEYNNQIPYTVKIRKNNKDSLSEIGSSIDQFKELSNKIKIIKLDDDYLASFMKQVL